MKTKMFCSSYLGSKKILNNFMGVEFTEDENRNFIFKAASESISQNTTVKKELHN